MTLATPPAPLKPDRSVQCLKARAELTDYITAWASLHKLTRTEVLWLLSEVAYLEARSYVGHERRKKGQNNGHQGRKSQDFN